MLVKSGGNITLIGAAPVQGELIREAVRRAPGVVAVDGGADTARAAGLSPIAVIGDMDSVSAPGLIEQSRFHQINEQDSTDFEKALRNISAPLLLGVGFCDGRLDHQLAACTGLIRYPHQRCILLSSEDLIMVVPPQITLELEVGERISLYPMAPVTGRSRGLQWPIDGLDLCPWGRIGTSNRTSETRVVLEADGPHLLLILPRGCLDAAIAALQSAPHWPQPEDV